MCFDDANGGESFRKPDGRVAGCKAGLAANQYVDMVDLEPLSDLYLIVDVIPNEQYLTRHGQ